MRFSLMFWGDLTTQTSVGSYYKFLLETSRFADEAGFEALWLPERHFHPWGGAHPNPSVLAAAVASVTKRIKIRSGSVVLPLHNVLRVAEEWSVVDNLSGGRVELSIASGWNANDFSLAPGNYAKRKDVFWQQIKELQALWSGESISLKNGSGADLKLEIFPKPVQRKLPLWVTSSGSLRTITDAGAGGFNLLTHLLGQDYETVERSIKDFDAYRARNGHSAGGSVALMLHTYLGSSEAEVKTTVKEAMISYLMNSADLLVTPDKIEEWQNTSAQTKRDMAEISFQRYFGTASLMGTVESAKEKIERIYDSGVTEVCCLVDFGLALDQVTKGLEQLRELKKWADETL